ncbi:hypothetical protein PQ465_20490 [Sphingobacterium oryzagri]|uniref:Uncharacterized protein n=1 Tax=Sphingobacterium oryzagri TaxID=3025669 RepID=A0ABY7WGB8_9SPHI|nr:STM3941 family protein [Sphingobacterium sp. KACC 22765]WDF68661.1 hypothetical protein PQ465_20490 [Sphingobacterium sp. KACC 22765]
MKTSEFFQKKQRTIKLLIYAAATCLLLLGVVVYSAGLFDNDLKVKPLVVSGALFVIMLALLVNRLIGLNDKSPLIRLTETTFEGRTAPLSKAFGQGEWADVKAIGLAVQGGDELVVVTLANQQKYSERLSKMMRSIAVDKAQNEINVMYSASEIDLSPTELLTIFQSYWQQSR